MLGDLIGGKRGATVVATGHSLGGALATLLTFELKYEKELPEVNLELYTWA